MRSAEGQHPVQKRAKKAKTQGRQAVVLLERARALLAEDNAMQSAIKHLDAAIQAAEVRAYILEDWYQRTYPPEDSAFQNRVYKPTAES
jgi:hypothetical protein